jgi:hypothetical protein
MTNRAWRLSAAALVSLVLAVGCGGRGGPKLATVRGNVTLGGKPLPQATVLFVPAEGRSSSGITDKNGRYELGYTTDRNGAVLGKHRVRISTYLRSNDEGKSVPESVPSRYNVESDLTREVIAGKNEINFELEAGGPIAQPSVDD